MPEFISSAQCSGASFPHDIPEVGFRIIPFLGERIPN